VAFSMSSRCLRLVCRKGLTRPWAVVPRGTGKALRLALASFCSQVGVLRAGLGGSWVALTPSRAVVASRAGLQGMGPCRVSAVFTFLPKHSFPCPP
jgi:hypothetical protein